MSKVMRSMFKEPTLSLHAPDLNISSPLVFSCQHQVAPKLLRDRAEDHLGVRGLPLCRYERCGCDKLPHRFFRISDRRLGAVAGQKRRVAASSRRSLTTSRPEINFG